MAPDFGKPVVEMLARRVALLCSNVDCRSITSGPADDPQGSVNIGKAAHIYGAKDGAARFRADMTDVARAEITNAIWLCRNCHKLVDSDPQRFPATLLFQWRAAHERYVTSKLGSKNDLLKLDLASQQIDKLREDSPLAGQIVRDKPCGWEFRLTAELLKTYLRGPTRTWQDIQRGLYSKATSAVDNRKALAWFNARLDEASRLTVAVATPLYTGAEKSSDSPETRPHAQFVRQERYAVLPVLRQRLPPPCAGTSGGRRRSPILRDCL